MKILINNQEYSLLMLKISCYVGLTMEQLLIEIMKGTRLIGMISIMTGYGAQKKKFQSKYQLKMVIYILMLKHTIITWFPKLAFGLTNHLNLISYITKYLKDKLKYIQCHIFGNSLPSHL